jgi:carboxyl-terminal processing protease
MTFRNWRLMSVMTFLCLVCALRAWQQRTLGDLGFAMDVIEHSYVEKLNRYELYQAAMDGVIERLDQYSGYIKPEEFPSFHSQIHQEFGGLGIVLERSEESEPLRIFTVIYDSPAFKSGLLAGDLIEAIDGHVTSKLKTEEATRLLRGPPGTETILSILRNSQSVPLKIAVRRAIIETESVTGDRRMPDGRWDFRMQAEPRLAYIRVEIFGEKTPTEFRSALASVRSEAQGLILDLRDNAGGLLPTATKICDMFLDSGMIVSTVGRREGYSSKHEATVGTELAGDIPIAVLINGLSASASEVTAACLQDHHRAVVIGQRSYGKGSVQNVVELEGGKAALRVTSAHYFPPSHRNIHRKSKAKESDEWGVHPDPGFEVVITEEDTKKVFQRLRDRGNPLLKPPLVSDAEKETSTTSLSRAIQLDPSIENDPQLKRAIDYLQSLHDGRK